MLQLALAIVFILQAIKATPRIGFFEDYISSSNTNARKSQSHFVFGQVFLAIAIYTGYPTCIFVDIWSFNLKKKLLLSHPMLHQNHPWQEAWRIRIEFPEVMMIALEVLLSILITVPVDHLERGEKRGKKEERRIKKPTSYF